MPTRDFTFDSGDVTLAGTVWLPDDPVAAVVMVGGSGPSDRHNDVLFPPIRESLLRARVAVMSYDKRGVGESTGSWADASINDFASDATAAYLDLCKRIAVPAGFFGHSEGGWTVLRAAPNCPDLAFVVTNSTPGTTPAEQDRYAVETGMRSAGETERFIADGLRVYDELVEEARRGTSYEEVKARLDAARQYMAYYGDPTDADWRSIRAKLDHDPTDDLARLTCPHLAFFGTDDLLVPAAENAGLLTRAAARRSADAPLTLAVFPGAGHRLEMADGSFAPDYLETLTRWITSNSCRNLTQS
jgi:pimeloyl-ACP methyl ester carboxylesterase